jgi:hypothetical protein
VIYRTMVLAVCMHRCQVGRLTRYFRTSLCSIVDCSQAYESYYLSPEINYFACCSRLERNVCYSLNTMDRLVVRKMMPETNVEQTLFTHEKCSTQIIVLMTLAIFVIIVRIIDMNLSTIKMLSETWTIPSIRVEHIFQCSELCWIHR